MKYWQGIPRNKEKDAVTEQKLSEGIYYYVIVLKDNITPYKGFISLFY